MKAVLALLLTLAATSPSGAEGGAAHKLHVSYGAAAVENDVVVVRIRFFHDDLEAALRLHSGDPGLTLADDPATEAAFLAYFGAKFSLSIGGTALPAHIVASGQDELDREPVWWYAVQLEAPGAVTSFRVRNALLLELFDDQHNIVKFVHFPDQTQKTYSFGAGEEEFDVAF
jgi:hypothetical protein